MFIITHVSWNKVFEVRKKYVYHIGEDFVRIRIVDFSQPNNIVVILESHFKILKWCKTFSLVSMIFIPTIIFQFRLHPPKTLILNLMI